MSLLSARKYLHCVVIAAIPFVATTDVDAKIPKIDLCEYGGNMNGEEAQTFQGECPDEFDDAESWYVVPESRQRNPKKYRVEHTEKCGHSVEVIENCSTNPDQRRCDDGSFPYIETIYRVGGPQDGEAVLQRLRCPEDPENEISENQLVDEIRITPRQFRAFPIQASALHSDPEQFSLRNGHTHLWALAETQTFTTNINGTDIEVRAIPVQWLWDYGDGTTRNLNYPGEPSPNHTLHHETPTSHSYTETGIFQVNLTTLYRGEFRIVGEGWQSIPGQAAVPSNAVPIDVWRTEKELVAPDGQ